MDSGFRRNDTKEWIPAFAGMTKGGTFAGITGPRRLGELPRKRRTRHLRNHGPAAPKQLRPVPLPAIAPAALRRIKRLIGCFEQCLEPRRLLELRESRDADADGRGVAKLRALLAEFFGDSRAQALGERDDRFGVAVHDD